MLVRFGSRKADPQPQFSGKYLTRLVLLGGFCFIAIVVLAVPGARESLRGTGRGRSELTGSAIQTAIAPSPFGELGMGVIVADDHPKPSAESEPANAVAGPGELPQVDRQLMQNVLDKTADRSNRAFYHLLSLSATTSPGLLRRAARRDVTYEQLWNEPDQFRGELIELDGYVRVLRPWQPTASQFYNPSGLDTLYDGYLLTEESRPNPYVIVMPRLADGMPTGGNISENVRFVGYFFKLWRYKAVDGTDRAAPLLVGQMISWTPAPQQDNYVRLGGYLSAGFILTVVTLGGVIWVINRRQARRAISVNDLSDDLVRDRLAQLEQHGDMEPAPTDSIHLDT